MLLCKEVLDGIHQGTITLAFRRWRRPSGNSGGTLLTAARQLHISSVAKVESEAIAEADACHAGFASYAVLLDELDRREGQLYRIEFGRLQPHPRIRFRKTKATSPEEQVA